MSVRILSRVFGNFHPESEVGDRLVLLVLADSAHDDGITWVSQEEIAAKSLLSERHVRRCLRELDDRGEIEMRKAQRGRRRINVYRVTVACRAPDYDRLPFALAEPFSTTGHESRSSEEGRPDFRDRDDRTSEADSRGPSSTRTRKKGPVSKTLAAGAAEETPSETPKLTKVDGRDQAFDALAHETGVDPSGNRAREVGIALNGSPRSGLALGIRALVWREARRRGIEPGEPFEYFLVNAIHNHARAYRLAMRDAALTPLALAKWWTDLDSAVTSRDPGAAAFAEARRLAEEGR